MTTKTKKSEPLPIASRSATTPAAGGVTRTTMVVTPALAAEWLKSNSRNRKLDMTAVERLATAIRGGGWVSTHQGIAFGDDGVLYDGQHRLHAIVAAGLTKKARAALDMIVAAPVYRPRVQALLMMSLRAQNRAAEALALGLEGLRLVEGFGGTGRTELMFRLALVSVLFDTGRTAAARAALESAMQQLQLRASRIPNPELRASFLHNVPTHVRLRMLAQQHL